jgi:hypothetical protein
MEVRTVVPRICRNLDSSDCQPLEVIDSAKVFQEAADKVSYKIFTLLNCKIDWVFQNSLVCR